MPLPGDAVAEITSLYDRYAAAYDFGEVDGWVATFTNDGALSLDRAGSCEVIQGVGALRAKISAKNVSSPPSDRPRRRHVNSTLVLTEIDEVTVLGRCYFEVRDYGATIDVGDQPTVASSGVYRDRIAWTGDGWRFAHRSVAFDEQTP